MHIPDGYLSPSTCAVMYGGAIPFWYLAVRRAKRQLSARFIPLLSVFAAFAFVVMMFNVPLPGGTTGHAVGVGIAAIALGPWGAIIAISVALFIQALFFGDGGITTFGANSFNMAIAGSLVAYASYRLIAGRASAGSRRRIVGSAIAGYLAINVSALLASIEFGVQPMLFKDASGAPLYAPYPLSISVPAMMIGHLAFGGLAELILTAGVVAYLDRTFPALLGAGAASSMNTSRNTSADEPEGALATNRAAARMWVIVSVLLVLTPLGLLAAGSAWGEWSPGDFSDPASRAEISAESRDQAPPVDAPQGMLKLSRIWTAPISHYAPAFMKSASFGYVLSAMMGCGLILLASLSISAAAKQRKSTRVSATASTSLNRNSVSHPSSQEISTIVPGKRKRVRGFVERTADGILQAFEYSVQAESVANRNGLLQRIDPRIKVIGMFGLIIVTAMSRNLGTIACILLLALAASVLSSIPVGVLATRIWIAAFLFTGVIMLPSIFITQGQVIGRVPLLGWPITAQGTRAAIYMLLRVETAATIAGLLVLSTEWPHLMKALRVMGVPALLVAVLSMSYRYSFLMLRTAREMFEARRSRLIGSLEGRERRRFAASSAGVLLAKTVGLGNEVYLAMVSRGFQGEAYTLDEFEIRGRDWTALIVFAAIGGLAIWFGQKG
jgi:cobalt/nickel transport system permease protein